MNPPNRDNQHGGMEAVGTIAQDIKTAMRSGHNWALLTPGEQEALDMVAHKAGRVLSGDNPHDPEHWTDLAGYPQAAMRGFQDRGAVPVGDDPWRHQPIIRFRGFVPPPPPPPPAAPAIAMPSRNLVDWVTAAAGGDAPAAILAVADWLDAIDYTNGAKALRNEVGDA